MSIALLFEMTFLKFIYRKKKEEIGQKLIFDIYLSKCVARKLGGRDSDVITSGRHVRC